MIAYTSFGCLHIYKYILFFCEKELISEYLVHWFSFHFRHIDVISFCPPVFAEPALLFQSMKIR